MADEWYCEIAGREIGPLLSEQLRAMAAKAQILPSDCVRQGGQGPWILARQVKGLLPAASDSSGTASAKSVPSSKAPSSQRPGISSKQDVTNASRGVSQRQESANGGRASQAPAPEILPVAQRLPQTSTTPASPVLQMPPVAPPMAADVFDPVALGILEDPATVKTETQAHAKSLRSREKRRLERQKMVVGVLAAAVVILAIGGLLLTIGGNTPSEQGHSASATPAKKTPPAKPAASPEALEAREGIDVLGSPKSKPPKISAEAERKPIAADFDHPKTAIPSASAKALPPK